MDDQLPPLSVAVLEEKFGTDEALGVVFSTLQGDIYSLSEMAELIELHGKGNTPELMSVFPDGTSAITCTNYAIQIAKALPGRVEIFGFANEDNPTSKVAREEIHPGGHDFALVDGRYLVDPWIRLVAGESEQIIFDFQDPDDLLIIGDFYGPKNCWERMNVAEREAIQLTNHQCEVEDEISSFRP